MKRLIIIVAITAYWSAGAGVAAALINLFMPLSQMEVVMSILGFGLVGLFVGLADFGPMAFRRVVAIEFAHRLRPTSRETVLWVLVAFVICGVFLFDKYGRAL